MNKIFRGGKLGGNGEKYKKTIIFIDVCTKVTINPDSNFGLSLTDKNVKNFLAANLAADLFMFKKPIYRYLQAKYVPLPF